MGLRIYPGPVRGSKSSERASSVNVKGFLHLFQNCNRPHFTERTRRTAAPLLFMRLHLNRPTSQTRSPTKIEGLHRIATWVAHFVASCDVYRRIGAGVVVELE